MKTIKSALITLREGDLIGVQLITYDDLDFRVMVNQNFTFHGTFEAANDLFIGIVRGLIQ